jgi:hypothetical protein
MNPRGAVLLADTVTYELDWHLAQDGMTLELPAGGTEIKVSE